MTDLQKELDEWIETIENDGLLSRSATARIVASLRQVIQTHADASPELQQATVRVAKALYAELKFRHSAHYEPPVHRRADGTIVSPDRH